MLDGAMVGWGVRNLIDLDAGLATNFHGFLNTPYIANEAGAETLFGKLEGPGILVGGAQVVETAAPIRSATPRGSSASSGSVIGGSSSGRARLGDRHRRG